MRVDICYLDHVKTFVIGLSEISFVIKIIGTGTD